MYLIYCFLVVMLTSSFSFAQELRGTCEALKKDGAHCKNIQKQECLPNLGGLVGSGGTPNCKKQSFCSCDEENVHDKEEATETE